MKRQPYLTRAFTLMEILVVVLVLVLLMCVLLPRLVQSKRSSQLTGCVANLKQVILAELLWINDNEKGGLSWQISTNDGGTLEYLERGKISPHFKALSNEIRTAAILSCPADNRKVAQSLAALGDSNLSYFMLMDFVYSCCSCEPRNRSFAPAIFGDRNLTNTNAQKSGVLALTTNACRSLVWKAEMHNTRSTKADARIGNVAYLDGSVATVNSSNLARNIEYDVLSWMLTSRLAIP